MDILDIMRGRRSIRRYQTRPVDDETVATVLEAARWAPSWTNTQCWRFIVVRDDKIKAELADTLIATERDGAAVRNPSTDAIKNAPVVIVAVAELGRSGYKGGKPATDKGDWYMFDVALAMQNLTLAAHALGLGTVHVGLFDADKATAILGIPQGFAVVEMTPLGYPDQQPALRPRKELAEIVFYNRFGNKSG